MASYDFDYAILRLRQAIDFAEIEHDFVPLRKMVNEVEASGQELEVLDIRLNLLADQEVLVATLQSVADGSVSPEAALLRIRRWLNSGQVQAVEKESVQHFEFA